MEFHVEPATVADVPVILELVKGLAEYERLLDEVIATEDGLRESLFGERPGAEVAIGYADGVPVGLAVYFHNYSTFTGRAGLYLEDIFVKPEWRRQGLGRQLLGYVARVAVARGCGRLEWSVLDWNEPAIRFYKNLGAQAMDEWTIYRMTGEALEKLAHDTMPSE